MRKLPYFLRFPHEFMVPVSSFKSSSIQHDVHFVNYCPIWSQIDDKAGYDSVRSNKDTPHSPQLRPLVQILSLTLVFDVTS